VIHGTVGSLLLQQGPKKQQIWGDSPSSPWEEGCGSALHGSAGFGDSTRGRVPEIETLGQSPGEHGVRPETWETGMIDCFPLGAHGGVGPRVLCSSRAEIGRPPFLLSSSKAVQKACREQKLPRANLSRLLSLAPSKDI